MGDLKQWVASRNTTFKMKDVERWCREGFSEIDAGTLKKVRHAGTA